MACIGNMPSFKYVTVENLVITYNNTPYPIKAFTTNKKYIVWNIDRPYQLEDTNVRPAPSLLEYLIVINDNGKPTIVEHDTLLYSFDQTTNGGNLTTSTEYNALKTEVKDNSKKFNLISNTVEGMSQIIGTTENLEDGTIIYNLNKVKSDSKSYGISIGEIQTKIDDKYKDIKPVILNDLVEYLRSVSEYKLSLTNILENTLITTEELTLIKTNKTNMLGKLTKLQSILSDLKLIIDSVADVGKSQLVTEMKNKLSTLQNALITICDSYLQDSKISGEEKTNIIQKAYELTTYIGVVQNTCTNITVNGQAGVVYSIENELLMLKDSTTSSIKELTRGSNSLGETIKSQTSEISQMKNEIKLKVEQADVTNVVNNKLNSYSTTSQMNSAINLKAGDITSEVSKTYLSQTTATNTYATKSSLKQTSDSIVASFSESGGYNLLKNSAFKDGSNYWSSMRWDSAAGGSEYIEIVDPNYNEWTPANRNSIAAGVRGLPSSSVGIAIRSGFDSHSFKIKPNTTYSLNCLVSAHRVKSVTIQMLCYDANGSRILDDDHAIVITDIRSGGRDRNNWAKIKHTWTTQSNAKTCHLRAYMNEWTGAGDTAYMWLCEPIITEGSTTVFWTPNTDEVYTGIVALDSDGVTVEMIDGEGSKGSSTLSHEGIATYDSNGNIKSWFSDDSAYIKELNVDVINNSSILQGKTRPTEWYVGQTQTGDGTGKDLSNKANSVQSVLMYIANKYGYYMRGQDIKINCDSGINLNENIYIGGWLGNGIIKIKFGVNTIFTGYIRVEECVPYVSLEGETTGWDYNDGCRWYRSDGNINNSALYIRSSNVRCSGFRSHVGAGLGNYNYMFAFIDYGSTLCLYQNDLVKYHAMCRLGGGSTAYINSNRGDVNVVSDTCDNSIIIAKGLLPLFNMSKTVEQLWNSQANLEGTAGYNSLFMPKVLPTPTVPTPQQPSPPSKSWHWVEKTFYFKLSSTTEGSGSATTNWSDKWGQGKWGIYRSHRGHAIPTESISSWCGVGSDTRNISMVLTMSRLNTNHGQYGAIPVPKLKQKDGSYWNSGVAFALGNTKSITLSSGIVSGLSDGSLSELTMWAGASTTDYSQYNGVSLKVKCEKYY